MRSDVKVGEKKLRNIIREELKLAMEAGNPSVIRDLRRKGWESDGFRLRDDAKFMVKRYPNEDYYDRVKIWPDGTTKVVRHFDNSSDEVLSDRSDKRYKF